MAVVVEGTLKAPFKAPFNGASRVLDQPSSAKTSDVTPLSIAYVGARDSAGCWKVAEESGLLKELFVRAPTIERS